MELFATLAVSVAVGLVVGILSGLLGIGGGMLLVPVLRLGYLMSAVACTATSLFTIILTSASGAVARLRDRTCLPRLGVAAGLGGACLSPVGVWLATQSPEWAVMAAAAAVILYSAVTMFRKALQMSPKGDGSQLAGAQSGEPQLPAIGRREMGIGALIGMGAGLASGYVGVGGGFIMVPLMMQLLGTPMKLTSGTSLLAVLILAIPGTIYQAFLGNIQWAAGIALAVGSIPGAVIGAKLTSKVPERALRFLFAGVLCLAAVLLVVDQL